ncbi:hypothetical protein [Cellulomonas oligotrophica]|uniref:Uncharacterized protein n=1 Tax=Cellulomonas oligotrophica TaxID=931536 RepID=A0A7Y9JZE8_9CELL|nr:hypothetical protein [Cellulomonas oligotrophica]NYD87797.1 hypothetical protein [Cellulomonas oligotrophica]GIG32998.1 hypothetical protein Col01nite_21570 [Cellulomonas oligotrophica]
MSGPRAVTATEALLAQAAAATPAEALDAQLALIRTGGEMLKPLYVGVLVTGDGTAGRFLLGGWRVDAHAQARQSLASRSGAIEFARTQAAAAAAGHVEHRQLRNGRQGASPSSVAVDEAAAS